MLLSVHPEYPQMRKIVRAAQYLKDGEIVAYPTDTGYGLGCDPFQRKTVERMFRLLNLPDTKYASLLCKDFKQMAVYGYISDYVYRKARKVFPGPYTLIVEATKAIPKPLRGKRREVGIRVPNNNVTLALIEELEGPILNVTARDFQGEYMDDPHVIESVYRKSLGAVVDCDLIPESSSTVMDLTGEFPEVVRLGQGDPDIFL
ncbi:MAG: threonylcarbamoyl-AMP synthase [Deltaproteobacteria bacterium]|nr:MAG: threonylcarbamoyl-AMP synthase [Deltaproteobacteria bacterium]